MLLLGGVQVGRKCILPELRCHQRKAILTRSSVHGYNRNRMQLPLVLFNLLRMGNLLVGLLQPAAKDGHNVKLGSLLLEHHGLFCYVDFLL